MRWLCSPLTWLLVATVLGTIACLGGKRAAWLRRACVALAAVALIAMSPLVANSLLAFLERPVASGPDCRASPPSAVVVLAGGVDRWPTNEADFAVLNLASRRRVERGVRYWRERDGSQVVMTGGEVGRGPTSHAELMGAYAEWLGLPAHAQRIESRSFNTRQNARYVARLMPAVPRRIALVTSASHMRRAHAEFRAAGFEVCPIPSDFRAIPVVASIRYLVPRTQSLVKTQVALHELAGIGYHHWRDWHDRRRIRSAADDD